MKIYRINAMILRSIYQFRHSLDRITDAFYWPTIELTVWGLTSAYLKTFISGAVPVVTFIISGIVFWYIIWRAQHELCINFLEELYDRNLINIFVSPLKFREWLSAMMIIGLVKAFISLIFTALVGYILYKVQVFSFGLYLIPFYFLLMMTGWFVGFFVTGLLLRFGTRIQALAWALVALISPFCGVYYPVSSLPLWAQKVALFIPASYVFEGMRQVISNHTLDPHKLYISLILNLIYMIVSLIFLQRSFAKILQKGLINLD